MMCKLMVLIVCNIVGEGDVGMSMRGEVGS